MGGQVSSPTTVVSLGWSNHRYTTSHVVHDSTPHLHYACRLSSQVLLSTLAVPITPVQSDFGRFLDKDDIAREKIRKLTSLLRLPSPPTRNSLLQDLVGVSVSLCTVYFCVCSALCTADGRVECLDYMCAI